MAVAMFAALRSSLVLIIAFICLSTHFVFDKQNNINNTSNDADDNGNAIANETIRLRHDSRAGSVCQWD